MVNFYDVLVYPNTSCNIYSWIMTSHVTWRHYVFSCSSSSFFIWVNFFLHMWTSYRKYFTKPCPSVRLSPDKTNKIYTYLNQKGFGEKYYEEKILNLKIYRPKFEKRTSTQKSINRFSRFTHFKIKHNVEQKVRTKRCLQS